MKKIFISLAFILFFATSYSQVKPTDTIQTETYDEKVTVIGAYVPKIKDFRKINFTPETEDTTAQKQPMTYQIISLPINVPFILTQIQPAKISAEKSEKFLNNFLKAGFGNYNTPYVEYFFHTAQNKKFSAGAHFKHISSNKNFSDYKFPNYSENYLNLFSNHFAGSYSIKPSLTYNRDVVHYYGFKNQEDKTFSSKDIKQIINSIDFKVETNPINKPKSTHHHNILLNYKGLWDKFETKNNSLYLDFNLTQKFDIARFISKEAFKFDLNSGVISNKNKTYSENINFVSAKPYLLLLFNKIELSGGISLHYTNDTNTKAQLLLPYAQLNLHIVPGYLRAFVCVDSDMKPQSLFENLKINPFINTTSFKTSVTQTYQKLYGGVSGTIAGIINYELGGMNRRTRNYALYINDTLPFILNNDTLAIGNRFMHKTDRVDILSAYSNIQIEVYQKLKVILRYVHNIQVTPTYEEKAWHIPDFEGNMMLTYAVNEDLQLKTDLFVVGPRFAIFGGSEHKMKTIVDVNIGAEYKILEQFFAFANINNLLMKRYYYWYGFPTQKLNFIVGLTYSF